MSDGTKKKSKVKSDQIITNDSSKAFSGEDYPEYDNQSPGDMKSPNVGKLSPSELHTNPNKLSNYNQGIETVDYAKISSNRPQKSLTKSQSQNTLDIQDFVNKPRSLDYLLKLSQNITPVGSPTQLSPVHFAISPSPDLRNKNVTPYGINSISPTMTLISDLQSVEQQAPKKMPLKPRPEIPKLPSIKELEKKSQQSINPHEERENSIYDNPDIINKAKNDSPSMKIKSTSPKGKSIPASLAKLDKINFENITPGQLKLLNSMKNDLDTIIKQASPENESKKASEINLKQKFIPQNKLSNQQNYSPYITTEEEQNKKLMQVQQDLQNQIQQQMRQFQIQKVKQTRQSVNKPEILSYQARDSSESPGLRQSLGTNQLKSPVQLVSPSSMKSLKNLTPVPENDMKIPTRVTPVVLETKHKRVLSLNMPKKDQELSIFDGAIIDVPLNKFEINPNSRPKHRKATDIIKSMSKKSIYPNNSEAFPTDHSERTKNVVHSDSIANLISPKSYKTLDTNANTSNLPKYQPHESGNAEQELVPQYLNPIKYADKRKIIIKKSEHRSSLENSRSPPSSILKDSKDSSDFVSNPREIQTILQMPNPENAEEQRPDYYRRGKRADTMMRIKQIIAVNRIRSLVIAMGFVGLVNLRIMEDIENRKKFITKQQLDKTLRFATNFVYNSCKKELHELYKESNVLQVLTNTAENEVQQLSILQEARTKGYAIFQHLKNILDALIINMSKKKFPEDIARFIAIISGDNGVPPKNYFFIFELCRIDFTAYGTYRNLSHEHTKMIILFIFLFRVLLMKFLNEPWKHIQDIKEEVKLKKNLKYVASIFYYILIDKFDKKIPKIKREVLLSNLPVYSQPEEFVFAFNVDNENPNTKLMRPAHEIIHGMFSRDHLAFFHEMKKNEIQRLEGLVERCFEGLYSLIEPYYFKERSKWNSKFKAQDNILF